MERFDSLRFVVFFVASKNYRIAIYADPRFAVVNKHVFLLQRPRYHPHFRPAHLRDESERYQRLLSGPGNSPARPADRPNRVQVQGQPQMLASCLIVTRGASVAST